mmetsp:Transcript_34006/g.95723  ORF Transcript_34006/g.95723 Transcript_34006/m.95723 type:complete len:300 (-) Transcript_34006:635-1534(-)
MNGVVMVPKRMPLKPMSEDNNVCPPHQAEIPKSRAPHDARRRVPSAPCQRSFFSPLLANVRGWRGWGGEEEGRRGGGFSIYICYFGRLFAAAKETSGFYLILCMLSQLAAGHRDKPRQLRRAVCFPVGWSPLMAHMALLKAFHSHPDRRTPGLSSCLNLHSTDILNELVALNKLSSELACSSDPIAGNPPRLSLLALAQRQGVRDPGRHLSGPQVTYLARNGRSSVPGVSWQSCPRSNSRLTTDSLPPTPLPHIPPISAVPPVPPARRSDRGEATGGGTDGRVGDVPNGTLQSEGGARE